jgi:hypothetical protein
LPGLIFALGDLVDEAPVASVGYSHRVRAGQGIVLQRRKGRFRYGTADKLEAIERALQGFCSAGWASQGAS